MTLTKATQKKLEAFEM